MGDSRGLLSGFAGIASVYAPEWLIQVWVMTRTATMKRMMFFIPERSFKDVDALYGSKVGGFGEEVGLVGKCHAVA